MKIFVAGLRGFPGVQGGIETHCENLYPRLVKRGCEVTVYTRKPYVDAEIKSFEGVEFIPVDCPKNKYLETIWHTLKCVRAAKRDGAKAVHLHAIGPSVAAPFAKMLGLKVIVTHHGMDYRRQKWNFFAKLFLRFCESCGMLAADRVITVSREIAAHVKQAFRKQAVFIPNGVVLPKLSETDTFLRAHGLQPKKYILAVGRLVPEKGFHDLVKAFTSGGFKGYKLVIAGRADHEDAYSRGLAEAANFNLDIIFTGLVTGGPLAELFSHAALFVLPSYHEGLPIALLEAMSYGLPCVASDIAANREVGLPADCYFSAGDATGLAEHITHFLSKPFTQQEKEAQLSLIRNHFNWDSIADQTLAVYSGLL